MYSKEYWNLSRSTKALGVIWIRDVLVKIGLNQKTVCAKMKNKARATGATLFSGSNLTREFFLWLMNNEDFDVKNWSVSLKKAGDFDAGWNFKIEGSHLKYREIRKAKCEYPYKCNTTMNCEYADMCKSPLAETQLRLAQRGLLKNDVSSEFMYLFFKDGIPYLTKRTNGKMITKKAKKESNLEWRWIDA